MNRTYRFKMKPTGEQEQFLSKCFGCSRYVYNYALSLKTEAYKTEKKNLSFFDLCAAVRKLKEQLECVLLKEVPALTLNYALLNLNNAYAHFFKTKAGFPKYKSKKRCRNAEAKDLSVREWTCPQCGTRHDRDVNAAMNIKALSLREYFDKQSPAVTGITDADGADSESEAGTGFPVRNYASVETSTQN